MIQAFNAIKMHQFYYKLTDIKTVFFVTVAKNLFYFVFLIHLIAFFLHIYRAPCRQHSARLYDNLMLPYRIKIK
jgi:hypothetical protein